MFGQAIESVKIESWLEYLRQVDGAERLGELFAWNLTNDENVCPDFQQRIRAVIDTAAECTNTDEAASVKDDLLAHYSTTCKCASPENDANRIQPVPFPVIARVSTIESFHKYNFSTRRLPGNAASKRSPRTRKTKSAAIEDKVKRSQIESAAFRPRDLTGTTGGGFHFATNDSDVPAVHPDEIRDRLGLADPVSFAQGRVMVVLRYGREFITSGQAYRPTTLDAGFGSSGQAFLPSIAGPPQAGRSQHLQTGVPSAGEILHEPVLIGNITRFDILDPLTTDPPQQFKKIRLGR